MANTSKVRLTSRKRRHFRVRKKIEGTASRPRLAVFRSSRHFVLQLIDDNKGHTIATASTLEAGIKAAGSTGSIAAAQRVGSAIAERAKAVGIDKVVFDRGGFQYHGRVAAAAQAARDAGLEF
jgi:large subunit ribosomal protein L18